MVYLNGFVGHTGHSRFQQRLSETFACRQMQIGEKNLAFAQQRKLCRERLFDFHDHVGARKNVFCLLHNLSACFDVLLIRITRTDAGIFFHQHRVTEPGELIRARRQERNALLLLFGFFWNTDNHLRK